MENFVLPEQSWKLIVVGSQNFLYHSDYQILVDCGIGKDLARKLVQQCGPINNFFISHSHADHYGGVKYLQKKFNLSIYTSLQEIPFLINPDLEPALLFGGYYPASLSNRWLLGPRNIAAQVVDETQFPGIQLIPLPGHTPGLFGIALEGVLFTSDAFFGTEILDKYPLLYHYNPEIAQKSLLTIRDKYETFIPAHGSIGKKADIDRNLACIELVFHRILDFLRNGTIEWDSLIARVSNIISPAKTLENYYLNRSALCGYISALEQKGEIAIVLDEGQVFLQINHDVA